MLSPDAVPGWVAARLVGLSGTRWVGVDGFGAAGKTTMAAAVARALPDAVVVAVDDFARPGLPEWDRQRFLDQLVTPLLAGLTASYQRWDFDTDSGAEWLRVSPGRPVIVEGVSSTDARLGVPWDLQLWLDVPAELRWQRVLERDPEGLLDIWRHEWIPQEQAYAASQRPWERVDAIVRSAA